KGRQFCSIRRRSNALPISVGRAGLHPSLGNSGICVAPRNQSQQPDLEQTAFCFHNPVSFIGSSFPVTVNTHFLLSATIAQRFSAGVRGANISKSRQRRKNRSAVPPGLLIPRP